MHYTKREAIVKASMKSLLLLTGGLVILSFFLWCPPGEARSFRNISSFTVIDYDGAGTSRIYENALITKTSSSTSLLVKAYHDRRSSWNNTIITLGPIINLDRYHYLECTYGYGFDSDNRKAHYLTFDLTREKPGYLAGLGYRFGKYPGYSFNVISPYARYYLTPRLSLWTKLFASIDSDNNFDQAYWIEGTYRISRRLFFTLGSTGGNRLYSPEYESAFGGHADMRFFSYLAQVSFAFNERLVLKYQFENITRQSSYTDIKNVVVLDTRF